MANNLHLKTRRKEDLKRDFKDNFGCKLYINKKGGCTSFTNGNVARLAFANPAVFSQITGVPESIIKGD